MTDRNRLIWIFLATDSGIPRVVVYFFWVSTSGGPCACSGESEFVKCVHVSE